MKWIMNNTNCPYCRTTISSYNKLIAIVDNKNEEENIMSKEDTFISIVKNKPDGKFLVFTKNDKIWPRGFPLNKILNCNFERKNLKKMGSNSIEYVDENLNFIKTFYFFIYFDHSLLE